KAGDGGASFFSNLLHGLLGVRQCSLLQKNDGLVEAVQAAFNNLRQCSFRLALFASGSLSDFALLLHDLSWNVFAGQVFCLHRSNLHCNCTSCICVAFVGNQNANCWWQVSGTLVQVNSNVVAFNGNCTTRLQLLADLCGLFVDDGSYVLALNLNCVELLSAGSLSSSSGCNDPFRESTEGSGLCNAAGRTVAISHAVTGNSNEAFGSFTVSTLGNGLCALDAQNFDGLVVVAASFFQGLLAVKHAGAGSFAQCLYISSSVVRHSRGDPPCLIKQCSQK